MGYNGVIGKIGQNITEGWGEGYTGLGMYTAIGAGGTAIASGLASDDGFKTGFVRGLAPGALLGASVNAIPKGISSVVGRNVFTKYKGPTDFINVAMDQMEPIRQVLQDPETKDIARKFTNVLNTSLQGSSKRPTDLAFNVTNSMLDAMPQETEKLMLVGEKLKNAGFDAAAIDAAPGAKDFSNYIDNTAKTFNNLGFMDKLKMSSSYGTKAGFDSAYHHIVEPTGQFIQNTMKGKMSDGWQTSAALFSAYGAYEGYEIAEDIGNGDYLAAAGNAGMLGLGKLAYSQGVNALKLNNYLINRSTSVTARKVAEDAAGNVSKFTKAKNYIKDTNEVGLVGNANAFKAATGVGIYQKGMKDLSDEQKSYLFNKAMNQPVDPLKAMPAPISKKTSIMTNGLVMGLAGAGTGMGVQAGYNIHNNKDWSEGMWNAANLGAGLGSLGAFGANRHLANKMAKTASEAFNATL